MEQENMRSEQETVDKVKTAMYCMTRQCWEQGILAQAMLETEDFDKLKIVVHDMVVRQGQDGRLCNIENTPAVTDSSFCIPAVYMLGKKLGREDYQQSAQKNIDYLLRDAARSGDGVLFHIMGTGQIWADSAAFLPYALALGGYQREAVAQMKGLLRKLQDSETELFFHMWDEEHKDYCRKVLWGIGNTWILTGILRLSLCLSEELSEEKDMLQSLFREKLDILLKYLSDNMLLHDVLDDPESFEESESSEMVAYAIFRAVKEGIISEKYIDTAKRIRLAIWQKVDEDGIVQGSAGSPDFKYEGTAVECQAHFLMMEKAYQDLNRN